MNYIDHNIILRKCSLSVTLKSVCLWIKGRRAQLKSDCAHAEFYQTCGIWHVARLSHDHLQRDFGIFHLVTCNSLAFFFSFLSPQLVFAPIECILQNGHQTFLSIFKSTLRYIFFCFFIHISYVSHSFSWCKILQTLCVCQPACVCVYGVFVTFIFCKRCKTANIHLLYKVSCFSPTITFGFYSFLHPVFSPVLLGFHSCHADCHVYTVDVSSSAELVIIALHATLLFQQPCLCEPPL